MPRGEPIRIAFFYDKPPERMPSYALNDYLALQELGMVRWAPPTARTGWRGLLGPVGWRPSRSVIELCKWCDVAVQWFAVFPGPGFACWWYNKPLLMIAGGYDVACDKQHDYGCMIDFRTRAMARIALAMSTQVVAVSRFSYSEARRWTPHSRVSYIYHGFDTNQFSSKSYSECRVPSVITVSRIGSDWIRKGLEIFVLAARELPNIPFRILGPVDYPPAHKRLMDLASPNVEFLGSVPHHLVNQYLANASVYAQLSYHESFCCALAEAMLCGCTPVVTSCGALPEVAGDCGFYVPPGDPKSVAAAISLALCNPRRQLSRERIMQEFPLVKRKRAIQDLVFNLLQRHKKTHLIAASVP